MWCFAAQLQAEAFEILCGGTRKADYWHRRRGHQLLGAVCAPFAEEIYYAAWTRRRFRITFAISALACAVWPGILITSVARVKARSLQHVALFDLALHETINELYSRGLSQWRIQN